MAKTISRRVLARRQQQAATAGRVANGYGYLATAGIGGMIFGFATGNVPLGVGAGAAAVVAAKQERQYRRNAIAATTAAGRLTQIMKYGGGRAYLNVSAARKTTAPRGATAKSAALTMATGGPRGWANPIVQKAAQNARRRKGK